MSIQIQERTDMGFITLVVLPTVLLIEPDTHNSQSLVRPEYEEMPRTNAWAILDCWHQEILNKSECPSFRT
jgi:hypothetical protein